MLTKSRPLRIKAVGEDDDLAEGTITAYASVFGNIDSCGDVVEKGAFSRTIKEWEERDDVLPLLWGHNTSDPDYNIGAVTKASEDDTGLLIEASFDLDNPKAAQVYRLCKGRRVHDLSFAFDIAESGEGKVDDRPVRMLKDLDLYECSIVPYGANPQTEIVAVKHAIESMTSHIAKNDETRQSWKEVRGMLTSAVDLIDALSKDKDDDEDDADQTSSGNDPLADEEQASSEKAAGLNPSDQLLAQRLRFSALQT